MLAQAYTLFAGIAPFVAAIGLFGLMSYNVSRRTREIGIRMAMGAQRKEVLGLVLRESVLLVIAGIAIGIAGALGRRPVSSRRSCSASNLTSRNDDGGHGRDARGVDRRGLSARTACNARRSDDCASLRIGSNISRHEQQTLPRFLTSAALVAALASVKH